MSGASTIKIKIRHTIYLFVMVSSILCSTFSYAQTDTESKLFLEDLEQDIKSRFDTLFQNNQIKFTQPDTTKIRLSEDIADLLEERLIEKSIFEYPFDSIPYWGIRYSKDRKIKIYNWNIKLSTGQYIYYGFLQYQYKDKYYYYRLQDVFESLEHRSFDVLRDGDWIGGNYYNIVDFKHNNKTCYLLLGYRHNYYESKYKILDVLYFSGKKMRLGKMVFKGKKKHIPKFTRRLLFEYSHYVSMTLFYDKKIKSCVFDDLVPETPDLEHQRRFYIPSGRYNALTLNDGKWYFKKDIKVRNTLYKTKKSWFKTKDNPNTEEYQLYRPRK